MWQKHAPHSEKCSHKLCWQYMSVRPSPVLVRQVSEPYLHFHNPLVPFNVHNFALCYHSYLRNTILFSSGQEVRLLIIFSLLLEPDLYSIIQPSHKCTICVMPPTPVLYTLVVATYKGAKLGPWVSSVSLGWSADSGCAYAVYPAKF
jgi:hypothetical protein